MHAEHGNKANYFTNYCTCSLVSAKLSQTRSLLNWLDLLSLKNFFIKAALSSASTPCLTCTFNEQTSRSTYYRGSRNLSHLSRLVTSSHICLPGCLDERDGVKQLPQAGCFRFLLYGLLLATRSSYHLHLHCNSSHTGDSDGRTSLVNQPSSPSQSST